MRRSTRLLQVGLLSVTVAALVVPFGVRMVPALVPPPAPATANLPAAQKLPPTLAGVSLLGQTGTQAPLPATSALSAALTPILSVSGGSYSGQVLDAATGTVLFDRQASTAIIPGSNLKLFTAAAVLSTMDPQSRFSTFVKRSADGSTLTLVAGGDALLGEQASDPSAIDGRAGLATLAQQTAAELAKNPKKSVRLLLDDSLFSGPTLSSAWEQGDIDAGEIAPIYPLALHSALAVPGSGLGRPQDAALTAAQVFAQALKAQGVTVDGAVARVGSGSSGSSAPAGGTVLASVDSATVAEQVGYMLTNSDNYVAEVLARMAAMASGQPGSFDAATKLTMTTATSLGVPSAGLVITDNSGLSGGDRVSPAQLAALLRQLAQGSDPRLRFAVAGLPIAGLNGTLETRYDGPSTGAAAGLVRAKTGTLNTVSALSGTVVDADGRLLVFSLVANDITAGAKTAQPVLDKAATVLAACGCR
ncbi:D-alanyl-D-alanine carboxypeptidase/D-alanyl-D-alanine-endopeptidase [Psychromicrobium xiongbiense]|uniref:D-alanyl-D-alanine carboxypeptidase/D-alanyl-D-alanine endopeptidase n=1 Tax=Psychromicrobium xiongbiense TaxID=3051184 RepID=UPI0025567B2A|nr:D-alanyl-D-alanine carboxypeptidase/D-alanyl-D-alanine-endopeptidase [Psychromicrobium sp. YIM S02556]